MPVVGPGATQEQVTDVKPLLDGASEYEYITIFNPLSDDFAVRVAQDIPVNMPMNIRAGTALVQNDQDVTRNYGLSLKNPEFQGRKHIHNDTIIRAGQTINLKGNEAQVAVRQLVNEILQREGNKRLMADPNLRHQVEERIIQGRGSVQDLMDANLRTTRSQIDDAINKSNEVENEVAFPGLSQKDSSPGTEIVDPAGNGESQRRPVGRPKKADS